MGVSTVGHRCLELTIVASLCAVALHRTTRRAQNALGVALAAALVCVFVLGRALIDLDFGLTYVADFARRDSGSSYRLAALWGGMAGSLLVWLTVLTVVSFIATAQARTRLPQLAPATIAVLASIVAAFAIISRFVADPFERLNIAPIEGRGLTPILHHPAMLYHPPIVYLGLTSTVVPFALTLAARLGRDHTRSTDRLVRRWLLVSWVLLTVGMLAGAHWSYAEVGWGGYWAWDPVENGVLLPWLAATFYLHSRQRARQYDDFAVLGCFVAAIVGAYVTRSGATQSVHSFAEARSVGIALAIVLGLLVVAAITLLVRDRPPSPPLERRATRRATALVAQNAVLSMLMAAVLLGTLYPLVRRALRDRLSVGGHYYALVCTPLVWALLLGIIIGPARAITRTYVAVNVVVFVAATAIALQFGSIAASLTLGLGAAALRSSVVALIRHPRRRAGGFIVHSGFALLLVGVAGSALGSSHTVALRPGERVRVEGYDITLVGTRAEPHDQFARLQAQFHVTGGNHDDTTLTPSLDIYEQRGIALPETAYRSSPIDDVMIAVRDVQADETVLAQITVRPLMWWLWWGGLLMTIGGLWCLLSRAGVGSTPVALAREQPRERVLL